MKTVGVSVLLALLILVAWSCWFSVDVTRSAVVTRFGNPRAVIDEPGFQWKLPFPVEQVLSFDKRMLVFDMPSLDEPAREFLTLDKKNVEVSSYVCWRISDTLKFLESMGTRVEAEAILNENVHAELGKVLGQHPLSSLLSTDSDELKLRSITDQIRETCGPLASREYGVQIVDVQIKRVNFPEQNRGSVFDRMRAERHRIATRYRSEGEEAGAKIRAEADRKRAEILADATRQAREIEGKAEAEATRVFAEAYGQDPEFYEFLRTLESYEKAFGNETTIILPADSPYLNLLTTGVTEQRKSVPGKSVFEPPRTDREPTNPPSESTDGG